MERINKKQEKQRNIKAKKWLEEFMDSFPVSGNIHLKEIRRKIHISPWVSWRLRKDIKQENYVFNHFKASYGPANGLYGVIKKLSRRRRALDRKWAAKYWKGRNKGTGQHKGKWGDRRQKGSYGLRKKNWWRHKDIKVDEKILGNWIFKQVLEIRGKRKLSYQNKKEELKIRS